MKTLEEILTSQPVFVDEFSNREDVIRQFGWDGDTRDRILFAGYHCPPYEGYALVLFERDGGLFEINASHCSCYGLEGQWNPEPVQLSELESRIQRWYIGGNLEAALLQFLGIENKKEDEN